MTFQTTFNPNTETSPAISYTGSRNRILNSSVEEGAECTTTDDVTLAWSPEQPLNGARGTKATFNAVAPNGDEVVFPCSVVIPANNNYRVSCWVYYNGPFNTTPSGFSEGPSIALARGVSGGSGVFNYAPLKQGWNKLEYITGHASQITVTELILKRGVEDLGIIANAVIWVDDWMIELQRSDGSYASAWEPADGDTLYTANQYWYVTEDGTFEGHSLTAGDLLYCVSPEYNIYTNASWEGVTPPDNFAGYLQQEPLGLVGRPLGHGYSDWRIAVQMLLPDDATSLWDVAVWDESTWTDFNWIDVTEWVRGLEWTRGASALNGRPEVGVATITLDNTDGYQFSPWNAISSFRTLVPAIDEGNTRTLTGNAGYLSPGTVIRVVCYNPGLNPTYDVEYDDDMSTLAAFWDTFADGSTTVTAHDGAVWIEGVGGEGYLWTATPYSVGTHRLFRFKLDSYPTTTDTTGANCFIDDGPGISPAYVEWGETYTSVTGDGYGPDEKPLITDLWWQFFIGTTGDVIIQSSADGEIWTTKGGGTMASDATYDMTFFTYGNVKGLGIDHFTVYEVIPTYAYLPQFTGIIESWEDTIVGLGAESFVDIVAVETISWLVRVNENAIAPVGNDDLPFDRIVRLGNAAGFPFGYMDEFTSPTPGGETYELQSTEMASNRLAEIYLTADSVGGIARTDKTGALLFHDDFTSYGIGEGVLFENGYIGAEAPNPAAIKGSDTWVSADYVADSVHIGNDDEPIINSVNIARVGGSVRSLEDDLSVERYGRKSFSRSDFICKDDDLIDYIMEQMLLVGEEQQPTSPLRVSTIALSAMNPNSLAFQMTLDARSPLQLMLHPLLEDETDGSLWIFNAYVRVDKYTHKVIDMTHDSVGWETEISLGVNDSLTFLNYDHYFVQDA